MAVYSEQSFYRLHRNPYDLFYHVSDLVVHLIFSDACAFFT